MKITKNGISFQVNSYEGSFLNKIFRAFFNGYISILMDSFWDNMNKNRWENQTFAIFDKYLDHDHSFIDIGAWIGPTLLYGCQKSKKAFGIEPDPVAFQILTSNLALNPSLKSKLVLYNGALYDKSGSVHITARFNFGDSMSWTIRHNSTKSVLVPSLTFNDFIKNYHIYDCNFINIDIEGSESVVLPTMFEYIKKRKPTLLVSFHPASFLHPDSDTRKISEILKLYKYLYTLKGKPLTLDNVHSKLLGRMKFELLVTERKWSE